MKYIIITLLLLTSCASSSNMQHIDCTEDTQVEFTDKGIVITNN